MYPFMRPSTSEANRLIAVAISMPPFFSTRRASLSAANRSSLWMSPVACEEMPGWCFLNPDMFCGHSATLRSCVLADVRYSVDHQTQGTAGLVGYATIQPEMTHSSPIHLAVTASVGVRVSMALGRP